jgi:hypothetical protein
LSDTELITELYDAAPFDPVPMRRGLSMLHVPFEDLVPGSQVETALARIMTGEGLRAAICGPSGCGKSSLIGHVGEREKDDVAVLRIPVEAEDDSVVSTPAAFAAHMLRHLARQAAEAGAISARQSAQHQEQSAPRERVERRRGLSGKIGLPSWLARAEVAAEAGGVLSVEVDRSAAEVIAVLGQLVDVLEARDLRPVVVLDDSDAWLDTAVGRRAHLVVPFFGRVLPEVVEELSCGWVVAVHDHYLTREDFPHEAGMFPSRIAIPELQDSGAIAKILERRIQYWLDSDEVSTGDVFEDGAIGALFAAYGDSAGNLRTPMQYAHAALEAALDDGAPRITEHHVQVAAAHFRQM